MSYDLMVFNPKAAPKEKAKFSEWYERQTQWEEDHDYDDPKVTTVELRNWFLDMIKEFPAMNGPYAIDEDDERFDDSEVTDYSIGKDVIYAGFRWSVAEKAFDKMTELASKHKVGFYDVSGSGEVIFPK